MHFKNVLMVFVRLELWVKVAIFFGKVDCIWPGGLRSTMDSTSRSFALFVIDRGGLGNGFLFVYYWAGDRALAV